MELVDLSIEHTTCPVCGCDRAEGFFELTDQPVLIGVQYENAEEACACGKGDLRLAFCPECSFIWNTTFDPGLLEYDLQYDNSLHYSSVFQQYTEQLVERLVSSYDLRGKTVIDIGCGKGDFLVSLCEAGGNRGLGFDPSYEGRRATTGEPDQIEFVRDLYSEKYRDAGGDLVCSRYVFEHVPDPKAFLAMVRQAIGDRGETRIYFEVPDVGLILRDLSVWDIIYEHCSYFSAASLARVFHECGFHVLRVESAYGGQFLGVDAEPATNGNGVLARADEVSGVAADVEQFVQRFGERTSQWRERFEQWRAEGRRVAAWGAGAKAVGFLNMLHLGDDAVRYVVDINPHKHGKFLAGTGHRVVSPEQAAADPPDVMILMNPIYRDEISEQLKNLGVTPELMEA